MEVAEGSGVVWPLAGVSLPVGGGEEDVPLLALCRARCRFMAAMTRSEAVLFVLARREASDSGVKDQRRYWVEVR